MSLTHGLVPVGVLLLTLIALVLSARPASRIGRRRAVVAAIATVVLVGVLAVGQSAFDWLGVPVVTAYYVYLLAPVLGLCLMVTGIVPRRWLGGAVAAGDDPPVRRSAAVVGAVLCLVLGSALVGLRVNETYDYYPTVASLGGGDFGVHVADVTGRHDLARADLERLGGHRTSPLVIQVAIPAQRSHFRARDAYVWIPPAFFDEPSRRLPVLLLLHGTPGQPDDWLRTGGLARAAGAYSRAHHGVGPVVVMPDINGAMWSDSECVNSPRGNVETYLTDDVPTWVRHTFDVPVQQRWTVAGLSEGGMCAAMLGLRHPTLFGRFADFSGLVGPTVGTHMQPRPTVRQLFHGSRTAFDEHLPDWLLTHRTVRGVQAIFAAGNHDRAPLAAQRLLAAACRADGLQVRALVLPGGHNWYVWRKALAQTFAQLAAPVPALSTSHVTAPSGAARTGR